jgi:hypothetical protein
MSPVWQRAGVRWVRRALVALLLAAPIVVVVVVAWPDEQPSAAGADRVRAEGTGPDGALVAGDTIDDEIGFNEVAEYRLVGDGTVQIDVTGLSDGTLTIRGDDGSELAFNDDTNGLDPQLVFELEEDVTVEVRDLGGTPGRFTLSVE